MRAAPWGGVAQRWAQFALLRGSSSLAEAAWRRIGGGMSRLRRLVVSDGWFFVTCRVLPVRGHLSDSELACLAQVIRERREEHGFLLSAWVFLPDHWHAILYPAHPLTISRLMESIGVNQAPASPRRASHMTPCERGRMARRYPSEEPQRRAKCAHLCATPLWRSLSFRDGCAT
jgi:REP element-mobilizing transposase RayT